MGAVRKIAVEGSRETGPLRAARLLHKLNQRKGFDCPGCAWPDPERRTPFEFCENGAKAVFEEATSKVVDPDFFATHTVSELTGWTDFEIGKAGRLTHPMIKRAGSDQYVPISWQSAFATIAEHLHALPSPDEAIFYTSGRTSNEAAFLYQLFVRLLGTNNLPDCSNLCHESSGVALGEAVGSGKGSVLLEDFPKSDAIFIFGQNPGTNHPRMLTALQEAKRAGATIVSVNPLIERGLERFAHPQEPTALVGGGTQLTDLYLQVRVGGDLALIKGICKAVLALDRAEGSIIERAFIERYTSGFDAFIDDLDAAEWPELIAASGVPRDQIESAARIYASSNATIATWAMGLTQHTNAVDTIQYVVNMLLLRGNIGKPGAGPCPVRGHSNVQGDRTMGIWEAPPEAFLERLGRAVGFEPPRRHGVAAIEAIRQMRDRPGKVFFAMGGNFLSANPDTDATAGALRACRLTVQVSTKLNRSHLITGAEAIILPCLGRTEVDRQASGAQFVTCENSQSTVQPSRGFLKPASRHLMSEPAIVAALGKATLPDAPLDWDALAGDYSAIRDLIEQVVPGHEGYDRKMRREGQLQLPHPNRSRTFPTSNGRAQFSTAALPPERVSAGQLVLMTMRSHDQYNTTLYGLDDRYRGIYRERRVLLMNARDADDRGLASGDWVDITSHFRQEQRFAPRWAVVHHDIPRGNCAAYFPEANVLVPLDSVAKRSNTPTSKFVVITIERSTQQPDSR
jgi:molybdopterin-dependent oxidoreductase alpha subunit